MKRQRIGQAFILWNLYSAFQRHLSNSGEI